MPEQRNQSGLTMVELLVGMVILGVVVTGVYNLFRVHNLMAAKQDETTRMQQELLSVMVQMADDIRMCGYTTGGGSNGFNATSNATTVICTTSPYPPSNSTTHGYRYIAADNTIESLNATGGWEEAASHIDGLTLTYLNADGVTFIPAAGTVGNIRFVEINAIAAATDERSALHIPNRSMSTRVYCRNMGL